MTRNRIQPQVIGVCALVLAATAALAQPAQAAFIQLSTHATGGNDATLFDALLEFTVTGNNLTLAVTNQTAAPNSFFIREIYFNTTAELASLTPVNLPAGFTLQSNEHAGGFGWFDYGIIGAGVSAVIAPGATALFSFTFTGSGVSESTFLSDFSSGPTQMIVAAKFVIGQTGPGGFGGANAIPTPGSTAMLLLAFLIGGPLRSARRPA